MSLILFALFCGPPLAAGIIGLRLGSDRDLRPLWRLSGVALVIFGAVGLWVMALAASRWGCESDCGGPGWTDGPATLWIWAGCTAILLVAVAVSIVRRMRPKASQAPEDEDLEYFRP